MTPLPPIRQNTIVDVQFHPNHPFEAFSSCCMLCMRNDMIMYSLMLEILGDLLDSTSEDHDG